ncbi:glycerophosphodiester phosphodiesterase [Hymenobacter weizhouensis]|uniref:glycerophosphodiester phosphodiesterase n=1 Tax=Hymenobacter sp. YIM 151500-1 TaxID=2987689 RepID=UPI002227B794|nr:glycerophosphodiester phosphodiesterase [Hymenobacter sp. YIM 151500-1]UYZ61598.1 glycerophosphodiester phosphodiesterase [Hymenobacter sp. YIM 151500-1]
MKRNLLFTAALLLGLGACNDSDDNNASPKYRTLSGQAPLVIGHRRASGLRPEHTLEAYTLAIEQGADFVEPDLVLTQDGVLVCRHEPMLSGTTNVASLPQFADRKTTKLVDGVAYTDWFASDFTLAEIKTLRAVQPRASRPQEYNGQFLIPTFQELVALVKQQSAARGRTIGVYPETKHPTFHERDLKLPLTDRLLAALDQAGWNSKDAPVYVQSFETANLRYIHSKSTVKLVQLLDADDVDATGKLVMKAPYAQPYDFVVAGDPRTFYDLTTDAGLDFVKTYAVGIGPWKPYIQPYTPTTKLPATDLIERAHKKGLVVHAYTFRNEPSTLLPAYQGDPKAEYKNFYDLGIDGVFTDFPGTAIEARP